MLYLAGGCFWGVERIFWRLPYVYSTAVGYLGGECANPTYEQVCTGHTGHAETVQVVYDAAAAGVGGAKLLQVFWENHDSTQLNRHGNDVGTQYRSAVWTTDAQQLDTARTLRAAFQQELTRLGRGTCHTTVASATGLYREFGGPFYLAEDYHQAYLHKHPDGYCNHGPNGVSCPLGVASLPAQTSVLPPNSSN